jgi:hypothetical protein
MSAGRQFSKFDPDNLVEGTYTINQIVFKGGYKYQFFYSHVHELRHADSTHIPTDGIFTDYVSIYWTENRPLLWLQKGYAFDGPSGPTFDTPSFMRGAGVHDGLYQLIRLGLLPAEAKRWADDELYYACKADGMWGFRAWYSLQGVHYFARKAASKQGIKPLLVAP